MAFPKIDGFVVTEKLGSGSYSTVYKANTKVGARSVVAIKCIEKSRIRHSGSAIDNLITEIRLLKSLTHPHIVRMKDFIWDDKNVYIITEYCCGGDLSRYIKRYGRIAESRVRYFLQQLASALQFLREKGVVHMDLKPHNLLLDKSSEGKYTLKVADFGFAQHMSDEARENSVKGSPLYMAPELVMGRGYDARVDLWSVGVIMYECLFGKAPYSSPTFKELIEKIQSHAPIKIPPNSSISPGCRQLLTSLLQHDPENRISYEDFFANPYLDLEHMPNDENYEKAVSLLRFAIDYDTRGRYSEAFTAYRKALSFLVPILNVQHDQMKKAALTNKLYSYMQRAEELQNMLYGKNGQPTATVYNPVHGISLIGTARENSIDLTSCEQIALPVSDSEQPEQLEQTEQLEQPEQLLDVPTTSTSNEKASSNAGGGGGGGGRLEFARKLFRRKTVSLTEPSEVKDDKERPNDDCSKKIPVGENVNDACRIT